MDNICNQNLQLTSSYGKNSGLLHIIADMPFITICPIYWWEGNLFTVYVMPLSQFISCYTYSAILVYFSISFKRYHLVANMLNIDTIIALFMVALATIPEHGSKRISHMLDLHFWSYICFDAWTYSKVWCTSPINC